MTSSTKRQLWMTLLWAGIVAISAVYLQNSLVVVSDIGQFMPSDARNKNTQVVLNQAQKSLASGLVFIQISDEDAKTAVQIGQELKISLIKTPQFKWVENGEKNFNINDYKTTLKHRYLLNKPNDFSVDGLRTAFNGLLNKFQSGAPDKLIEYLLLDPQMVLFDYLLPAQSDSKTEKLRGVWFVDGSALLLAKLSNGLNVAEKQAAIQGIKNTFNKVAGLNDTKLLLSGSSVIALDARSSIQNTIQYASWVLISVIFLVFWLLYRSIYWVFLASLPLGISIVVTMAIVQFFFGQIHGIVLAFGITALGVCLDYPLHLFSHLNNKESASTTFRRIWPTLRMGALTSILAYLSLIDTGFIGLTQLAIFAALGLLIALMVSRFLLPLWIKSNHINFRKIPVHQPLSLGAKRLSSVVLIIFPLIFLSTHSDDFSSKVGQINPASVEVREADKQFRAALGSSDINHLFLIAEDTIQKALTTTESIQNELQAATEIGLIAGSFSASNLLPSHTLQKQYQALLLDKTLLQANVSAAIVGTPFKASAFNQFINEVALNKTGKLVNYADINQSIIGDRLRSMLFENKGIWYSVIRVSNVKHGSEFVKWINDSATLSAHHHSISDTTSEIMNRYQYSIWIKLMVVLLVLAVAILTWSRKQKQRIWIIVPVLSGVLVSLSAQIMLGHAINIFHLLSLLLVIGMGLDYGLFFNQRWDNKLQLQQRTHAITISAVTTIATFSVLSMSDISVLSSIGQVVTLGILVCFLSAKWLSLPAISEK